MDDVGPRRPGQLLPRLAEQQHPVPGLAETGRRAAGDVLDDPEHGHHRGRQDRGLAGLVVEAHVAAGDRDAELDAGVLEPAARLRELPHHRRVLRRAEVQAVADRQRGGAARRDVAVGLRERELRTGVRVEAREPAVAVGGEGDAEVGVGVDADHAAVAGLGEDGVALHVAVVLVGDPGLVAQVRAGQRAAAASAGARRRSTDAAAARPHRPAARPGSRVARTAGCTSVRRAPPNEGVRRPPARRASRSAAGHRR